MRVLTCFLIFLFAAGLADIPPVQAEQQSSHRCCSGAAVCHCKEGSDMTCRAHKPESTNGVIFKALGCGAQGEKAISSAFAKDYYLSSPDSNSTLLDSSFVFLSPFFRLNSWFNIPAENPPELLPRI